MAEDGAVVCEARFAVVIDDDVDDAKTFIPVFGADGADGQVVGLAGIVYFLRGSRGDGESSQEDGEDSGHSERGVGVRS